jgi:hypothetical protein
MADVRLDVDSGPAPFAQPREQPRILPVPLDPAHDLPVRDRLVDLDPTGRRGATELV